MKQTVQLGKPLDFLTQDELVKLLPRPQEVTRIRATATVALDATGSGVDEVYKCPMGHEFAARRVTLDISGSPDPSTGNVPLGGSTTTQTDVDNSASGAATALTATLPGAAGATTYITGFEVTGTGATAASVIAITVTGVSGGTKTYELAIPAGATTPVTPLMVEFSRPIPASGLNTAIAVNVPSFGAGNTNAAVTAHGFQQVVSSAVGKFVAYLRSGTRIEYAVPQSPNATPQVPGVQTWSREQGPYLRNAEVFEVQAKGLTANGFLSVILEGLLTRPAAP